MSIDIITDNSLSKAEKYELLIPQINSLIRGEKNFIANIANITSAIKYSFENFLWVGFYFLDNDNQTGKELVLGPFQGRVACARIPLGKGVCGTSAERKETIIAEDVDLFPGHIVCDSLSRSEIVVPILKNNETISVLDIDSDVLNNFDTIDKKYIEVLTKNISYLF
jgi:L-methionine (R)-S-oxide reductase